MTDTIPFPEEPLDVFGGECPPGYIDDGSYACPRDEAARCPGCDGDGDSIPPFCGHGVRAYRSIAWTEWAKKMGFR